MAYQTGTITHGDNLLSTLATFISANGWTINRNAVSGGGREVLVSKGSAFFNLRGAPLAGERAATIPVQDRAANVNVGGVWINGSVGYNAARNWHEQDGREVTNTLRYQLGWMPLPLAGGPFTYHFFCSTVGGWSEVYVWVQFAAGDWVFLMFGETMGLVGNWGQGDQPGVGAFYGASMHAYWTSTAPGTVTVAESARGPFYSGSSSHPTRTRIRQHTNPISGPGLIDGETFGGYVDALTGVSPWNIVGSRFSTSLPERYGYSGRYFGGVELMHYQLARSTPNAFNLADILIPIQVFRERRGYYPLTGTFSWSGVSSDQAARSIFGVPKDIRITDMTNRNPGDTLLIGSDTWRLFPNFRKAAAWTQTDTYGQTETAWNQLGYAMRQ